jgi:hypothetical protein
LNEEPRTGTAVLTLQLGMGGLERLELAEEALVLGIPDLWRVESLP